MLVVEDEALVAMEIADVQAIVALMEAPDYALTSDGYGAPELFPVMSLVSVWFTRRETEERRAFHRIGISRYKSLIDIGLLW